MCLMKWLASVYALMEGFSGTNRGKTEIEWSVSCDQNIQVTTHRLKTWSLPVVLFWNNTNVSPHWIIVSPNPTQSTSHGYYGEMNY